MSDPEHPERRHRAPGRWAVARLVAAREIRERLQGRLIRVMTVVTAILVVAGVVLPGLLSSSSATDRLGLVGSRAQALRQELISSSAKAKRTLVISTPASDSAARALVKSGKLDAALEIDRMGARVVVTKSLSAPLRVTLQDALNLAHLRATLAAEQIPVASVLAALRPVPLRTVALNPAPPDQAARAVAAIAAALLMYVSLAMYGGAVATGVAQEKTSRTAEVLLGAVKPWQLLSGKVAGIGLTGLGQLSVAALAGLVADALVHSASIPASVWVLMPAFLACFLLGFLLYAFAFAAAGALVGRQEEVQLVTTPIAMPLLIGYLVAYAAIPNPDAVWLKVISFVPPLMATVLPARIALGHIAWWEIPVDLLLMLASIYGMARLAARVYSGAMLRSGGRIRWRQAFRLGLTSSPER